MSYDECVSLAWLYTELNGDSWGTSGRWFLYADPEEWYGYNGVNGNQTGVIDME